MVLLLLRGYGGVGMMGGSYVGGSWMVGIGFLAVVGIAMACAVVLTPGVAQPAIPPPYPHPEWGSPPSTHPAVQILDARYARGEISREQCVEMRKDIESRNP
ncbi:MAG TPA: SHOCT domain-containing protein [Thermoplasmata archaeon]|nr:SHOCT domain-containing protein [Thermoplasmata archaeon]